MQVDSNSSHVMYTCESDGYDLFQEYRLRDCGLKSDIRRGTVRNVPVFVLPEYPPVSCLPLSLPPNLSSFLSISHLIDVDVYCCLGSCSLG